MGGFVENPPPPEAPEYPPENAFDIQSFVNGAVKALREQKVAAVDVDAASTKDADAFIKSLAWLLDSKGDILAKAVQTIREMAETEAKVGIDLLVGLTEPLRATLGDLTKTYVRDLVQGQGELSRVLGGSPAGLHEDAAGMFQTLVKPLLGLDKGAADPRDEGAGQANAQYTLGSIIQIHLSTWIMDMIGSMLGTLCEGLPLSPFKWIHSFDRVITQTMNARSVNRIAIRPYLEKYIKDPLTRDLNINLPLDSGSPSSLIKAYIRGGLSREALIYKLRGQGFNESVTEQLLLDNIKMISTEAVAWLVNRDIWSEDQALEYLEQQGYPAMLAPVILALERTSLQRTVWRGIASDLISAVQNHDIEPRDMQGLLENSEFTEDEVRTFMTRATILRDTPTRISYSQLKQLYAESLVDLDYVLDWLHKERYSDDDADRLCLLEFTKHEDRTQRASELAERRRVAEDDRRKAKALLEISQAQRAAKYGIPWPPS